MSERKQRRAEGNWPQTNIPEAIVTNGRIDNRETRRAAHKMKINVPILVVMRANGILLQKQRRVAASKVIRFLKATPEARP